MRDPVAGLLPRNSPSPSPSPPRRRGVRTAHGISRLAVFSKLRLERSHRMAESSERGDGPGGGFANPNPS